MIQLRKYQQECLSSIIDHYRTGICRQLVSLPTASGKTVIFSHLIQMMRKKTVVIAHTKELLHQAKEKIEMICPDLSVGLLDADHKEFDCDVIIASIQSARQEENLIRLKQLKIDILIYDEAHHSASDSARMVLHELGFGKNTNRLLVGFSATIMRSDGRGLGQDFDKIVYEKSIREMLNEQYLCQPVGVKITTDLDLSQVKTDGDDFAPLSLGQVMDTPEINQLIVSTFLEKAADRKAVCFSVSIQHASHLAEAFKANGVKAEMVCGSTPKEDRESILSRFKNGDIDLITNCQILTEGWDCPQTDCIIVARPTKARSLYVQMAGRGLRRHPGKSNCLILDFGDANHTLCSTNILLGDAEMVSNRRQNDTALVSLAKELPPSINKKLKRAILEYDLLGQEFFWQRDKEGYFLKGSGNKLLRIISNGNDRFDVVFLDGTNSQLICADLTFEFSFGSAEDFIKANRSHFVVSDLNASWRDLPITAKQKKLFRSFGYRAGIDDLTRGAAATLIGSGILNRKIMRQ